MSVTVPECDEDQRSRSEPSRSTACLAVTVASSSVENSRPEKKAIGVQAPRVLGISTELFEAEAAFGTPEDVNAPVGLAGLVADEHGPRPIGAC